MISRAFSIGADREETRAIVPQVGLRLWNRPVESDLTSFDAPDLPEPDRTVSPSSEGGGN